MQSFCIRIENFPSFRVATSAEARDHQPASAEGFGVAAFARFALRKLAWLAKP